MEDGHPGVDGAPAAHPVAGASRPDTDPVQSHLLQVVAGSAQVTGEFGRVLVRKVKTLGGLVSLRVLDLSMHPETYSAYDFGVKRPFTHQTTNSLKDKQTRYRSCTEPPPAGGGRECSGDR